MWPAVDFQGEKARVFLTSMASCLVARGVYKEAVLADCLSAVGYRNRSEKCGLRSPGGPEFDAGSLKIPDRFKQVATWKGPLDTNYLNSLRKTYAQRIHDMAKSEEDDSP